MQVITYGFYKTEFGRLVIGRTERGLCWLGFMTEGYKGDGLSRMKTFFPRTTLVHDDAAVQELGAQVMKAWAEGREAEIALDLQGTPFQRSVWEALLKIPRGATKTYGEVANDIGRPKAMRAVGSAVGENPVSLIVPCHRVLPRSYYQGGGVGNYGWGSDLKEKLLEAESQ